MSSRSRLPPELCDRIIDQLRGQPHALMTCSVVCKSWTPRSRKHLFTDVAFTSDLHIKAWGNMFPNPANSPARHTRTLTIKDHLNRFPENFHVSSFRNITVLCLNVYSVGPVNPGQPNFLAQLHGFAPSLKWLRLAFTSLPVSDIMSLICSFPLLDNLLLHGIPTSSDAIVIPPKTPTLNGKLCLSVYLEMRMVVDQLLSLPGGIHFREMTFPWITGQSPAPMMDLISACSRTLECIHLLSHAKYGNTQDLLDLSSAVNLKTLVFRSGEVNLPVGWIAAAIGSIKSNRVENVMLQVPEHIKTGEDVETKLSDAVCAAWQVLDKALVKFLTARSFKLKLLVPPEMDGGTRGACARRLLPNLVGKKLVESYTLEM